MRDLFLAGIKLLGLSVAVSALNSLAMLSFSVTFSIGDKMSTSVQSFPWILGLHAVISLVIAWFLLMRSDGIAELLKVPDTPFSNNLSESALLMMGIQLMGIWLLATGAIHFAETVIRISTSKYSNAMDAWQVMSKIIRLAIGLWMASAPWKIAGLLKRRSV